MANKLHYFNPGHETAVLHGKVNYTPSKTVSKMMQDLAFLPVWYSEPGDVVLVNREEERSFFRELPGFIRPDVKLICLEELPHFRYREILQFEPWGLTPSVLHEFKGLNKQLQIPDWKKEYTYLTGRMAAIEVLKKIKKKLPTYSFPVLPAVFTKEEEVTSLLTLSPQIIKSPYSSSGRGLLWIKDGKLSVKDSEWIRGTLKKQQFLSIEPALDKIQDFALEFYSDGKGNVQYRALSLFQTWEKGAYEGNCLGGEKEFLQQVYHEIGEETYQSIKEHVIEALEEVYAYNYTGYLGVDMMLYKREDGLVGIHPCVEVNMRHTMGLLASCFYEKNVLPASKGKFYITYEGENGSAYRQHIEAQKNHPLVWEKDRIKRGYLALCPVDPETQYRAYIQME